jgi:YebC/PmpR family DNA-binding regulatory protein
MVDALTDNRNRTTPHMRKIFSDHGGEMGATGCVSWTFESRGLILLPRDEAEEEELFEAAIEAGADDFQEAGDYWEVSTDPKSLHEVRQNLEGAGVAIESAEITMVPKSYVTLSTDDGRKVLKMMEEFEDDDDVTNVYANFDLSDELMAELEAE